MTSSKTSKPLDLLLGSSLSLLLGAGYWWLSGSQVLLAGQVPLLFLLWSPMATLGMIVYLVSFRRRQAVLPAITIIAGMLATSIFAYLRVFGISGEQVQQTLIINFIHLPLICWFLLWWHETRSHTSIANRFAFLRLSLNYFATVGIFMAVGGLFTGVSFILLNALGIHINEPISRLFIAGGGGLVPLLAFMLAYQPRVPPARQPLLSGIGSLIQTVFRLLIPLLSFFLTVYLLLIPGRFLAPFHQREVLVIYNLLVFMVLGVIVGSVPVKSASTASPLHRWLYRGHLWLVIVTGLILTYAFAALVYRLLLFGLTPNRFTILGWDLINLYIFTQIIVTLIRVPQQWAGSIHRIASASLWPYLGWSVLVILASSFVPLP